MREIAAARALFEEGVECADGADWECAADRFERARMLRPSPVIAYNLGHALVRLGRLVEGTEILRQLARDERAPAEVRRDAAEMAEAAEPRIGRLAIHVDGPLEGLTITLDALEVAPSLIGTAAPVDPGEHHIVARRGGEVVAEARAHVEAGGAGRVDLSVPPLPPAPASVAPEVPAPQQVALAAVVPGESAASHDDGPWIALGVTSAVLVVGGAIVLAIVLAGSAGETPFAGNLGRVELGP